MLYGLEYFKKVDTFMASIAPVIHATAKARKDQWQAMQTHPDPKTSPLELCRQIHERYLVFRKDIIDGLKEEHRRVFPPKDFPEDHLSERLDYGQDLIAFNLINCRGTYANSSILNLGKIFEHLHSALTARVVDLGSGLGEVCFTAALWGGFVCGIEIDPDLFASSVILRDVLSDFPGVANVDLQHGDYHKKSLSGFTLYHAHMLDRFLLPAVNHITTQAATGSAMRISSSKIKIPSCWQPDQSRGIYTKQAN